MANFTIPPIIPWTPQPFPPQLVAELIRRETNRNFNFVNGVNADWKNTTGNWQNYRGPMSPFFRFTSNGQGYEQGVDKNKPGFIFTGGKDFFSTYGFSIDKNNKNQSIIGYQANTYLTPHTIENDLKTSDYPIHVPCPEIERISVNIQKELYRKATVEWTCFSKKQLEYMTPYFLVPGISCVLEWGWNHYDPSSLLDVSNTSLLVELNNNPYPLYTNYILQSNGNYDVMLGIITNFEFSLEGNKIKCRTEITSKDRIYAGLSINSTVDDAPTPASPEPPKFVMGSLVDFINKDIDSITSLADKSSDLHAYVVEIDEVSRGIKQQATPTPPTPTPIIPTINTNASNFTLNQNIITYSQTYDKISNDSKLDNIKKFIKYVMKKRPNNWKEYIYGIFNGRNTGKSDLDSIKSSYKNVDDDFDFKSQKELWLNMGLVIEILNYHASELKQFGEDEIFRIDLDPVKIGAHKNMISTNGRRLLVPNSSAPKYFVGGNLASNIDGVQESVFKNASETIKVDRQITPANFSAADVRVYTICNQQVYGTIFRDDLDELINQTRTDNYIRGDYSFPNFDSKVPYTEGYLKDLYINTIFLKELIADGNIKTYTEFIEKLLDGITSACGNFWDLRLVSSLGIPVANVNIKEQSTMKIIDYKYMGDNTDTVPYTFKYMSNESILMGLDFKPTLSNAQAIRCIYAPTDKTQSSPIRINNGSNELLDYHFRDRLYKDSVDKSSGSVIASKLDPLYETLKDLQTLSSPPEKGAYQMTTATIKNNPNFIMTQASLSGGVSVTKAAPDISNILIRRLVLPNPSLLDSLLDDGDYENNPAYTGIMPGIQASFTIQGIGGLRTFMMFLVDGLPAPYSKDDIIFRITDVTETIEAGKWITQITAGVIPLRNSIKAKLGLLNKK